MKVLVIGHSPSSREYCPRKGNPSINRLNKWLDECGVEIYSFSNACAHHAVSLKKGNIDRKFIYEITKNYYKILGLGNEVNNILNKMDIEHFSLPHPSPLNRKLNDKVYEKKIINNLKSYLQVDSNLV
ncbi:uracil-DNA glycosylase family protein [bacterium]|jgi:hypothetical protein|nr:uracil-DNA glycosylase family protein [bacterium]MDB4350007.1 uracil-DNA glycosylase family protein [bacterium]